VLWFYDGAGMRLSVMTLVGIVALTLALINASINSLRSRLSRGAIALRKSLIAGREFFVSELRKEKPALRDEWYPWALAFGLTTQIDDWSAQRRVTGGGDHWLTDTSGTTGSHNAAPAPEQWGGFSGGRSGGAGGGATWAAAAVGMAAGVPAPSASGSGSSGDDSGSSGGWSGGGSSGGDSGGSSGGGGGGGW
jgi:hypothetical protein